MGTVSSLRGRVAAALLLGALSCAAFAQGKIVIGQSTVLAGPGALRAEPYYQGAKLYFDRVNAAGGVNGRKIELVTLDDHGSPALTAENTKKLLSQQPVALFGYYGSSQVKAAYPAIKDADIVLFAPMSAADELRDEAHPNIYTMRPGYADEAAAITRHAATLGATRLAIIHANDAESVAAFESAQKAVPKQGATLVGSFPFTSGQIAGAVDNGLSVKPQSMLVIADANSAAGVVRDLRVKGFRGPIYGFSNTGEGLLAEEVGAEGAGVVVARVVPKSENPNVPVARELVAEATTAKLGKPNVFMLEGYLAARVLTEALRRIPGEPTRAKVKTSIEGLRNVEIGGFRVDYSKGRVGSKLIDLALIDSQGRVRE